MSRFNLIDFIPIIIIGCFVFSLILGPTLLWPKYQSLKELQNSINAKKIELEAQEQYFADIEAVKVKLAENEEATSKIDSALPDSVDIPSLFNFIQQACNQSGLVLEEVSPFAIAAAGGMVNVKEVVMSLRVSGSYTSFKSFLGVLEKSARLVEVEDISFASPTKEDLFTIVLKIKIHSY
ncbi:MAG TPA: type 4a pilus biogenesis protein PilO [Candidatus Paceibacterota bacterium]|nr:type 4a pilus biogenesis protein PilO [Candidatus Paceibacterota bacterium]